MSPRKPGAGGGDALVTDIQRFSIHDGPGIRTTVFFKGCPLSCQWCHNPETIRFENEPLFTVKDCIGCGDCVRACPGGAIKPGPEGLLTDWNLCKNCLGCAKACPSGARSPAALAYDPEGLLTEVLKDRDFYEEQGGVTLSGGEPLARPDFLETFLPALKEEGIHLAVETCGFWDYERLSALLDHMDLFLFDIKAADEKLHKELTGKSNRLILKNLKKLVKEGRNLWLRMPFIPGKNDGEKNLKETADLASGLGLDCLTLLHYHNFGETKQAKMRPLLKPLDVRSPDAARKEEAVSFFAARGIRVKNP